MTNKEIIDQTKQLIAIPSTGDNPEALQNALDFIADLVWQARPDITIERFRSKGKPSLLAYKGKERPKRFKIIFNGHLDVVPGKPEQFKAVVKDGKLYGRGAYDMKAACVVMANVFCEYVNRVPYDLGLQIVCDEESAGHDGTLHQIQHGGVRGDFVIIGECGRSTTAHEIANRAKGVAVAKIKFRGKAAHSAYPWKGKNAANHAARFVHVLHERYPRPDDEFHGTTVSVTGLTSDSGAHSLIPDDATVKICARFVAGDPDFHNLKNFKALIKKIDPEADIAHIYDFSSPMYTRPNNPLLLLLKKSAEKVEGAEFKLVRRHGTSDGRFYGDVGDESCEFGIAGDDTHGDNEYVPVKAVTDYYKTLHNFLQSTI